ncbi:MAG TPA: DUF72 domain-containing protein [Herminiimonas sp.]|nr:DUF72 domain-containing protein [Herminiimonas sp.]
MSQHLSANVRIGCAGWSLSSRVAESFPVEGSHLERYAAIFSAVEINSSFYRPHQPKTYARWRDSVPEDFRFSVKIPRTISHDNRLRNADDLLDRFLSEAGELERKLGCLLLQLPPSLKFIAEDAEAFFTLLRQKTNAAIACEPRHATWFADDAALMLRRHAIGCVRADPAPVSNSRPAGFDGTAYIRLHGSPVIYRSAYDDAFIAAVADRIAAMSAHADPVWCIFDNTADGAAVPNALSLMRLLR